MSNKTIFWDFINGTKDGLIIPLIQRDYVQGRNTEKIAYARSCLLNDLHQACISYQNGNNQADLNYVYGAMENGKFTPIDGQQRLTMLLCLHLYAFSRDGKHHNELMTLKEKFTYETRPSTGRFLVGLADHFEEFFKQTDFQKIKEFIEDCGWYQLSWNKDPSVCSIKTVLDEIHTKFADLPDLADILLNIEKRPIDKCPITFMQLMIDDMGKPSDQYVKMNSRGKALTDFETFKSELFNIIDDKLLATDNFKAKIDGDWADAIWEVCLNGISNPTEEDVGRCDDVYMRTLHHIILNRLYDGYSAEELKSLQTSSFYNFANYLPFIKNENGYINDGIVLKDIYYTLSLVKFLQKTANATFKSLSFFSDIGTSRLELGRRIALFAFVKYATELPENEWSAQGFFKWHRVTSNLIANVERNEASYKSARNRIGALPVDCLRDTYAYFSSNSDETKKRCDFVQIEEEIVKAKLIYANSDWEPLLIKAEEHDYFNHEIYFALKLLGIDETNIKSSANDMAQFNDIWQGITEIFGVDKNNMDKNWWVNMRRLLLTYGDYSYKSSYYGPDNFFKTYYYEDEYNHYNVDWRGFLRSQQQTDGADTFAIFKDMFEDWRKSGTTDFKKFANDRIESYVKNNTQPKNDEEELRYLLIKDKRLFEYIHYSGFIWKSGDSYYLLATKNRKRGINYKLYAIPVLETDYVEYKSNDTTEEHIDKNHHIIMYNNEYGYYMLDGVVVTDGSGNIRSVFDMINYLTMRNIFP